MEDLSKLKLYDDEEEKKTGIPSPVQSGGKRRGSFGLIAIIVVLGIGFVVGFGFSFLVRSGTGGVEVSTDFVVKQSSARPVVARKESGWIEVPDDRYPLYITALTTGRLEKVMLRKGMTVKKGQEVALVYSDYLKSDLDKAEAEYGKARSNHEKLKSGYRKQEVEQARARADKAAALVKKAEAAHNKSKADLVELKHQVDLANITYIRAIPLLDNEAISEQRLDELRSQYEEAKARYTASEASAEAAAADVDLARANREESLHEYKLMLEGYRKEDIDIAAAELVQLKAKRNLAKLQYENRMIKSPWDGVILHQFKHGGDVVSYPGMKDGPGGIIASVYNPKELQARIQLDLERVMDVFEGQTVLITTDVEGSTVTYEGKVARFDPEADYKNNVVWVKVDIKNPSENLHPEMVCKAQFLAREQEKTPEGKAKEHVLIPLEAVVERGVKTFVFTIAGGRARRVSVELGGTVGGKRVVKSGLSGGEEVITSGHTSLSDGTPVRKRSGK
jgi:RND family efflux transporter MFP subunit